MYRYGRNMAAFDILSEKKEIRCPVCDKLFQPAEEHSYYIIVNGHKHLVCTYTCRRKWEKSPVVAKKSARKKVKVKCLETGVVYDSITECAEAHGTEASSISHSLRTGKSFKGFHFEGVTAKKEGED